MPENGKVHGQSVWSEGGLVTRGRSGAYFELADLIVREVDCVELVLRCAEILNSRDLVRAKFDLTVFERVGKLRAAGYEVWCDPHRARAPAARTTLAFAAAPLKSCKERNS